MAAAVGAVGMVRPRAFRGPLLSVNNSIEKALCVPAKLRHPVRWRPGGSARRRDREAAGATVTPSGQRANVVSVFHRYSFAKRKTCRTYVDSGGRSIVFG